MLVLGIRRDWHLIANKISWWCYYSSHLCHPLFEFRIVAFFSGVFTILNPIFHICLTLIKCPVSSVKSHLVSLRKLFWGGMRQFLSWEKISEGNYSWRYPDCFRGIQRSVTAAGFSLFITQFFWWGDYFNSIKMQEVCIFIDITKA